MKPLCRNLSLAALVGAIATAQTGCIALTAKLRAGPVADSDGNVGFQADVAFGFGYAISTDAAVTGSLGVGSGSRDRLQVTDTIEYHRFFDDGYGLRTGARVDLAPIDDRTWGFVHGAFLYPLKSRHRSGGGEKAIFHTSSESRWSAGIEGRVGYVSESWTDEADKLHSDNAAAFGLSATLEYHLFERMR